MRSHLMDEITNDAYIYKELFSSVKEFTITVESLLQSIRPYYDDRHGDKISEDRRREQLVRERLVKKIIAETQGSCSSLNHQVDQITRDLEHHLKFLELRRGVQESTSLWVISILASVFLPLSLASSMQTRFVDLGTLLYDFCGVVVLLMTLVGVLIALVRGSLWVQERLADFNPSPNLKTAMAMIFSLFIFATWGLVLSSFVVGMQLIGGEWTFGQREVVRCETAWRKGEREKGDDAENSEVLGLFRGDPSNSQNISSWADARPLAGQSCADRVPA
ncbi:hypothetical protein PG997_001981 [Apiospora hydei]|uniref:Ankyrin repeat protein n=1 Tax=Apiospora hydei TaxID=1337664 RepID=A0ABR1X870_9PEZI